MGIQSVKLAARLGGDATASDHHVGCFAVAELNLANETAENGRYRRLITPVHTWAGLVAGWLLFAIFITGTLSVFDAPLSRWLNPELYTLSASDQLSAAERLDYVAKGEAFFREYQPNSGFWGMGLPNADNPGILLFWELKEGGLQIGQLHPETGEFLGPNQNRGTEGGHHFVHTHFELHAGDTGVWIVGAVTMLMLLAMVSGVIVHKRIFKDFFTLRFFKGQRSWLDAHTLLAVLTLPFLLMIGYSGLAIQAKTYLSPAINQHYDGPFSFYTDLMQEPPFKVVTGEPAEPVNLVELFARAEQELGQPANFINVERPADSSAMSHVFGKPDAQVSDDRVLYYDGGRVQFNAITGEMTHVRMPDEQMNGGAFAAEIMLERMHMAEFGGMTYRWLLFVLGLLGSGMIAAGTILFWVKRRQGVQNEFGRATPVVYRVIEALNIAAITGLLVACIGFFWANRLLPMALTDRAGWEITAFFGIWLLTLLHAAVLPAAKVWAQQCWLFALLCLFLPLLNWLTTGEYLVRYAADGRIAAFAVEFAVVICGVLALWLSRYLQRRAKKVGSQPALPEHN